MTLTLDWNRASSHPLDGQTERLDVPFAEDISENLRQALSSALVSLEVVGGPIEAAKLSHDHIRLEVTSPADIDAVKQQVEELVQHVVSRYDPASP